MHEPLDMAAGVASAGATPEQQALQQSEAQRLAAMLATLPARERELMAMKYGADMTNRAIARATAMLALGASVPSLLMVFWAVGFLVVTLLYGIRAFRKRALYSLR